MRDERLFDPRTATRRRRCRASTHPIVTTLDIGANCPSHSLRSSRRQWSHYGALTQGAIALFALLSLAHDPLFQAPVSMALMLAIGLGLKDAALPRA